MPIRTQEIGPDIMATITENGRTVGSFIATGEVDKWLWTSTAFPVGGFELNFTGPGSVNSPTYTFTDYPFVSPQVVPKREWSGSTIYLIKRNGTACGWLERYLSGGVFKLMWWSNGVGLVSNRIKCNAGDVLAFTPGSLPSSTEYPLEHTQQS